MLGNSIFLYFQLQLSLKLDEYPQQVHVKLDEYPPTGPCQEIAPCYSVSTRSVLYKFNQKAIAQGKLNDHDQNILCTSS